MAQKFDFAVNGSAKNGGPMGTFFRLCVTAETADEARREAVRDMQAAGWPTVTVKRVEILRVVKR